MCADMPVYIRSSRGQNVVTVNQLSELSLFWICCPTTSSPEEACLLLGPLPGLCLLLLPPGEYLLLPPPATSTSNNLCSRELMFLVRMQTGILCLSPGYLLCNQHLLGHELMIRGPFFTDITHPTTRDWEEGGRCI